METHPNDLEMGLWLLCIVLLWVLQRYYIANRPLGFFEGFLTIPIGVFAGAGIARLMQFQTLREALVVIQVAMELLAVLVTICVVFEAAYNVIMSLVALRKK